MISVHLSLDELQIGSIHGTCRYINALRENRGDKNCEGEHSWDDDINAACAEIAWCKHRGIYWTGLTRYRAPDGGNMEVRWTRHKGHGGVICYPRDNDATYLLLVDGRAPHMNLIGTILCWNAKEPDYWKPIGKGYFLAPRDKLKPLNLPK